MAATNINKVVLTGNLTRDPELRSTPSGFQICELRVAVNTRRKDNQSGEWVDKPNYFDVKIFGRQGENAAQYLSKGRPVAIDGRLDWSEWQDKDTGKNRQKVEIVAENIQFLGGRDDGGGRERRRSAIHAPERRPGGLVRLRGGTVRRRRRRRAGRRHPVLSPD